MDTPATTTSSKTNTAVGAVVALYRALFAPDPATLPEPSKTVKWVSGAFLVLAFGASEWVNIEATRIAHNGRYVAQAVAIAAWPPFSVMASSALIELGGFRRVLGIYRLVAYVGALSISATTMWTSYWKQVEVILHYGFSSSIAHTLPIAVDGFILVAGAAFYTNREGHGHDTEPEPEAEPVRPVKRKTRTVPNPTPGAPATNGFAPTPTPTQPVKATKARKAKGAPVDLDKVEEVARLLNAGMTQGKAAEQIDVDPSTIFRWKQRELLVETDGEWTVAAITAGDATTLPTAPAGRGSNTNTNTPPQEAVTT